MKKIISVFLAAIMAFGVLPAVVFAAGEPIEIESDTYPDSVTNINLGGNNEYVIPAGEYVVILASQKLTLGKGSSLTVNGRLEIAGALEINGVLTKGDVGEIAYTGSSTVIFGGERSHVLPAGDDVVIDEGQKWTVAEGSALNVYCTLYVKGTLVVNGSVTAFGDGEVVVRCWKDSVDQSTKCGSIQNVDKVVGNETGEHKRYFAEVYIPPVSKYAGCMDAGHQLTVRYLWSRTGSQNDYLDSDLYYESLQYLADNNLVELKYTFDNVYPDETAASSAGVTIKAPLNQYLFLRFDFLVDGQYSKKYDGNRMSILFNRLRTDSVQGVCTRFIDGAGEVEFVPTAVLKNGGTSFPAGWKDSYFLRQERIYLPSGQGYSVYGVKDGVTSANDQTVYLDYGEDFAFRVNIDDEYSDSAYSVYLVQGYKWNDRNKLDTLESLLDEIYIDENGNPQHYVWKFEAQNGDSQKVYIDAYGVYHIASVDDEYTIVVTNVVSNETLSLAANVMDTIRNLLNALKQFFERIKQMLGLG